VICVTSMMLLVVQLREDMVLPYVTEYIEYVSRVLRPAAALCFTTVPPVTCTTTARPAAEFLAGLLSKINFLMMVFKVCDQAFTQVFSRSRDYALAINPSAQNRDFRGWNGV
jgi:hypothetical protein